jgi:hypothetical protein
MSQDTKQKRVEDAEDQNATPQQALLPNGHPMSRMLKYGGGTGLAVVVVWMFVEGVILTKEQRKAEYDALRFQIIEEMRREQLPVLKKLDALGSRLERIESGVVTRDQFSQWIYERNRENRDKGIDWGALPMSSRQPAEGRQPF